jgi:uncharacterized protein (DUF302 family)
MRISHDEVTPSPSKGAQMIVKQSRHTYADTIAKLEQAMTQGGNTIFSSIDQSAAAAGVGLSLRPTTLIVFGNPKGGTPFMVAFPRVAMELPLKLLVWAEDGSVSVAYVPMSEIASRCGVTGMNDRIDAIDHGLDALTNLIT